MIQFANPYMFFLLILPLLYILLQKNSGTHGNAIRMPLLSDIKKIKNITHFSFVTKFGSSLFALIKYSFLFILWFLLVVACAKPQIVGEPQRLKTENRDIMLVIDISTSMLERDFSNYDRLSAVKAVVGNFIEKRTGDRLGLILFATRAYLQAPLTFDRQAVGDILYNADAGMAGPSTSIGDALGLALKNLKNEKNKKNKIIILLTDGEQTDGALSMAEAIDLAEKEGIKVYTIGVGNDINFFLFNMANNSIDEKSLKEIAKKTKGNYFRAKNLSDLSQIYNKIDQLEPVNNEGGIIQDKKDLYYIPLFVALILVMILLFIPRSFIK